jgi:hypothetical protein
MKKLPVPIFLLALVVAFASCERRTDNQDALENEDLDNNEEDTTEITVTPTEFPQYPDAKLTLNEPREGAKVKAGNVRFSFNVENYELGQQTENAKNLMIANSDKGQHIHYIEDNDPYSAHYEPVFEKELSEGHHVILAFLSRSYHASVKNEDAFVVRTLTVGNPSGKSDYDPSQPHMFYSRPKGTYSGKDAQRVLLDFYLVNTDLSVGGNRIRATINGQEFMLDKWQPYIIEGLPMGEATIKLELLDSENNLVESPFNPVTRTVTLEGDEGSNM